MSRRGGYQLTGAFLSFWEMVVGRSARHRFDLGVSCGNFDNHRIGQRVSIPLKYCF